MIFKQWVVGAFQCNCTLIACDQTAQAALIDSGDEGPHLVKEILKLKTSSGAPLELKYLLHTHAHLDHVGATRQIKEQFSQSQIALHRLDLQIYLALVEQGKLFGFSYQAPLPVELFLEDEQELALGTIKLKIIHTPGHSPGGICIKIDQDSVAKTQETLFTGDTLFNQSIGRTDLWGGSSETLLKSIKERLFRLDDDTTVYPGHGPKTKIGFEKRSNPFLK